MDHMVLQYTCYRYEGLPKYYIKLQFSAFWSIYMYVVKLCLEKMLILRCIFQKK